MTPREPDRYDKIARDIFAQWERTRNAYPRDIAAALRQAADEALERAARAFAERGGRLQSGYEAAAFVRALASPAAAHAAEPCRAECASRMPDYSHYECTLPKGHVGPHKEGSFSEWTDATTVVAPSLLPRVLAVLDAEYRRRGGDDGGGYVGALAAELRRYIAGVEVPGQCGDRSDCDATHKRIAELEVLVAEANRQLASLAARRAALADGGEGK